MQQPVGIVRYLAVAAVAMFPILAHGAAQTPPSAPVTVVNTTANAVPVSAPNALPVTGTVNVGNLGATTLPVSVTNFPATQPVSGTVSVGNLPAVQAVSVTNSTTTPVLARVLNGPGSNPFVMELNAANPSLVVPATINGRAVEALAVTQISGGCTGIGSFLLPLQDAVGGSVIVNFLFQVASLQNGFFPITTQQTQIYIPTGHSVVLGDAVAPHGCRFDLSGYYVAQ
jgi:hypothetical protein